MKNIAPAVVEECSVVTPVVHSDESVSLKNSVNELEEVLC